MGKQTNRIRSVWCVIKINRWIFIYNAHTFVLTSGSVNFFVSNWIEFNLIFVEKIPIGTSPKKLFIYTQNARAHSHTHTLEWYFLLLNGSTRVPRKRVNSRSNSTVQWTPQQQQQQTKRLMMELKLKKKCSLASLCLTTTTTTAVRTRLLLKPMRNSWIHCIWFY